MKLSTSDALRTPTSPAVSLRDRGIRRVLILGHTGLIGKRLHAHLTERHEEVEIIGVSMPDVDLTVAEHAYGLKEYFEPETAIVMCSGVKRQLGDSLDIFELNMSMAANVCRVLESCTVGRFIYFSSAAVYGEEVHNLQISESTPVHPMTYYGAAKFASECLLRKSMAPNNSNALLVVRPPLVYGEGDPSISYGPVGFIKNAIDGRPITLWGDGTELREFVYVQDVAQTIDHLLALEYSGVLNLACGRSRSFREALDILFRLLGTEVEVASRPRSKGKVDNVYTGELLRELLPELTFTSLEEGMRRTIAEYRLKSADELMPRERGHVS